MFYAYVIRSEKDGSFYKGHCENIEKRLIQHNAGLTRSIKNKTPFNLVFFETFITREDAVKREKYYKSAAGRKFLKSRIDIPTVFNTGSLPE